MFLSGECGTAISMEAQSRAGSVPRRYEALAYIVEQLVRTGHSPTYDEIGDALGVKKTRARELVDQLIGEQIVDRPAGKHRSFVIRDVTHSRAILVGLLNRLGWVDALPSGELAQPRTYEQLPMLPPFEHLPDIE